MATFVEICSPDGSILHERFSATEAVLGRDALADVAIVMAEDLAPRHLKLLTSPEGVAVEVLGAQLSLPSQNGLPFRSSLLPWGEPMLLGNRQIRFARRPFEDAGQGRRWAVPVLLLLLAGATWLMMMSDPAREDAMQSRIAPLKLFEYQSKVRCTAKDASPGERGEAALQAARSKMQRYPFAAADGLSAVALYAEAAACFERARNGARSTLAVVEQKRAVDTIDEDYRMLRLRLMSALEREQYESARREALALLALLGNTPNAYVDWLRRVERQLVLELEEKGT